MGNTVKATKRSLKERFPKQPRTPARDLGREEHDRHRAGTAIPIWEYAQDDLYRLYPNFSALPREMQEGVWKRMAEPGLDLIAGESESDPERKLGRKTLSPYQRASDYLENHGYFSAAADFQNWAVHWCGQPDMFMP